jgi:hypothetical protein
MGVGHLNPWTAVELAKYHRRDLHRTAEYAQLARAAPSFAHKTRMGRVLGRVAPRRRRRLQARAAEAAMLAGRTGWWQNGMTGVPEEIIVTKSSK